MRTKKTPIQNLMRTGRFLGRLVVEAFGNFNEEGDEWIFFFGVSLVAALAVGIVSHLLLMAVLAIHVLFLQLIYTGLLLVVNALILTLQLWVFWQTYRERTETGLYMVSLSLSAVGIALCIESFAALVLLIWPVPRTLGQSIGHRVWFVEGYFLWHLADSLPFLKVPSSVGWRQPLLDEKYIGLLRLIFQVVVLAPLVHIATSGYETWQRQSQANRERDYQRTIRTRTKRYFGGIPTTAEVWFAALRVLAFIIVLAVFMYLAFELPLRPYHWLAAIHHYRLHIGSHTLAVGAIAGVALQWVIAILMALLSVSVIDEVSNPSPANARTPLAMAGAVVTYIGMLLALTLIVSMIALALIDSGLASVAPPIPAGSEVALMMKSLLFQLVDVIPGLDVERTLEWPAGSQLTGRVGGSLVVAYRFAAIVIIAFPVAAIVRAYLEHIRLSKASKGLIQAPIQYLQTLRSIEDALAKFYAISEAHGPAWTKDRGPLFLQILRLTDQLESLLPEVTAGLGPGSASELADAAFTDALRCRAGFDREYVKAYSDNRIQLAQRTNAYAQALHAVLAEAQSLVGH
jgi:hypothetical protein